MKPAISIVPIIFVLFFISGCGTSELPAATLAPSPANPTATAPANSPAAPVNTPAPATVTGTIVDSEGTPMPDVGVRLFKKTKLVAETKTNAEGEFVFKNIAPGRFTITYDIAAGPSIVLHNTIKEFVVEGGSTTRQDIVHDEK